MVKLCTGSGCRWGASGQRRAATAGSSTCLLCEPPSILKSLTDKRRSAFVRSLRALTKEQLDDYISTFEDKIFARELSIFAGSKKPVQEASGAVSSSVVPAPVTPEEAFRPKALPAPDLHETRATKVSLPDLVLSQGDFGLCTPYAVATATSHALSGKYMLCVEAGRLAERWFDMDLPRKSAWPDDFAHALGSFRVKMQAAFLNISLQLVRYEDYETAARVVHRFAGLRCVVIVMTLSGSRTHSVVGVRTRSDGSIMAQNSWGPEKNPFPIVTAANFVSAYLVDPTVESQHVPDGKYIVKAAPLPVSSEWEALSGASRTWS